jgi:hypothetical protein
VRVLALDLLASLARLVDPEPAERPAEALVVAPDADGRAHASEAVGRTMHQLDDLSEICAHTLTVAPSRSLPCEAVMGCAKIVVICTR